VIDPSPRTRILAGARSPGCRGSSRALAVVATGLLLAGCSGGSGNAVAAGPSGGSSSGPAASLVGAPSANPGPSTRAGASAGSSSAGAGPAGPTSPAGHGPGAPASHPQTRYPSPAGMTPPAATAASVVGCQPLIGGGWQATFVVTLTGGTDWAVVPQHGPASRTGADQWTVVIRQGTGGGASIALTRIEVGGGSPYRTATVALGLGVAATASCPS
jgi:hypothetical protein